MSVDRMQVAEIQDETLPPSLIQFVLDLDVGELQLAFSEAIDIDTFNPLGITLQSDQVRDGDTQVRVLTGGTATLSGTSEVTLQLVDADLNQIKLLSNLGSSQSQTFIVMVENVLYDEQNTSLVEITADDAQMAEGLELDTSPPILEGFDLDLDGSGEIVLHFSEFVRTSSFQASHVEFRETDTSPTLNVSLYSSTFTGDVTDEVTIEFGRSGLEKLKLQPMCTMVSNCFLTIVADVVTDLFGRANTARQANNPAPLLHLTNDTTSPELDNVESININTREIELLFDEPMDIDTLNITAVMLHSSLRNDPTLVTVALSENSTSDSVDGKTVHIDVSIEDIDAINTENSLCTSGSNCWVRFTPDFIKDMSGNPVAEVSFGVLNIPGVFEGDNTKPNLIEFDLDINNRRLYLVFDEPVSSALDITEVSLQSSPTSASTPVQLLTTWNSVSDWTMWISMPSNQCLLWPVLHLQHSYPFPQTQFVI